MSVLKKIVAKLSAIIGHAAIIAGGVTVLALAQPGPGPGPGPIQITPIPPVTFSGGAVGLNGGVNGNVLLTAASNLTITNTMCGKTIQAGTGSVGYFSLTLPAVSGFPATCSIAIKNGDTTRGKQLIGFPSDFAKGFQVLWPLQFGSVQIINGVWATGINPGIWQASGGVTLSVDHTSGSNAVGNDCLAASGVGSCATIYHAWNLFQNVAKPGGSGTAIIQSDCGGTETPPAAFLGPSGTAGGGGGVVFIIGNQMTPSACDLSSQGMVFDDGAVVSIQGFHTINVGSGRTWITAAKMGTVVYASMAFGPAMAGAHIGVTEGGIAIYDVGGAGGYTIGDLGCSPGCMNYHVISTGYGHWDASGATINLPRALTFNAFYSGDGSGSYIRMFGITFTGPGAAGGSTGAQYTISDNATLISNGVVLPGSSPGVISTNACGDSVCKTGTALNFSGTATCNAANLAAQATITDSNTATWGANISGGGSNIVFANCNGSNWTVVGK